MKLTRTVLATALVGLAFGVAAPLHAQPITGAGASFPNPVYQKWGEAAALKARDLDFDAADDQDTPRGPLAD